MIRYDLLFVHLDAISIAPSAVNGMKVLIRRKQRFTERSDFSLFSIILIDSLSSVAFVSDFSLFECIRHG